MFLSKLKTRIQNAFRLKAPEVSHSVQEHDELVETAGAIDFADFWTRFCGFCFQLLPFLQSNDGSNSSDNSS